MYIIQITSDKGTAYMTRKEQQPKDGSSSTNFHWDKTKALIFSKPQAEEAASLLRYHYPKLKIKVIALASTEP